MSEKAATNQTTPTLETTPTLGRGRVLARLATPLAAEDVTARLRTLSKRGKLPGFREGRRTRPGALLDVDLFGATFDQRMVAYAEDHNGGRSRLRLERHWKWKTPLIMAALILISIEPGATLIKSFLPDWGWITTHLRWWYYPLTIAQIPFVWRMVPKSRAAAIEHAGETIERLRAEIDAELVPSTD